MGSIEQYDRELIRQILMYRNDQRREKKKKKNQGICDEGIDVTTGSPFHGFSYALPSTYFFPRTLPLTCTAINIARIVANTKNQKRNDMGETKY